METVQHVSVGVEYFDFHKMNVSKSSLRRFYRVVSGIKKNDSFSFWTNGDFEMLVEQE